MFGKLALVGLAVREYQHHKQQKTQQSSMAELEAENQRLRNLHQVDQYAEAEQEYYQHSNEKAVPVNQPERRPQQMRIRNEAGGGMSCLSNPLDMSC